MISRISKFLICFFVVISNAIAIQDLNNENLISENDKIYKIAINNNTSEILDNNGLNLSDDGLSLIEILDLALKNNPKIKEVWTNIDTSKYSYRSELSNLFPTINGEITYSKTKTKYDDGVTATSRKETMTPSITLSYLLFDFGGREADILNFKYKLNTVKYETNDYIQTFIYNVINEYYILFSATANEKAAKEAENSSYEAFKAASVRYKIGLVPLTDKLQAETSYTQDRLNREKLENNTKIEKANLNYLLNLSPVDELKLSIPKLKIKNNDFQENVDSLIKTAIENRPDLKAYYEAKKAKKSELYSARINRLPSVSLNSSYGHTNDLERNGNDDRDNYNIEITATMPFFTGGYLYNNSAKTKSELKAINYQIEDLRKNIELDVWTAYQNFITAKRTHITTEILLKSATETEKTILGKYKNGKSSILDLLSAQSDLASARYSYIEAQHNWFINRANLLRSLGKMSIDELNSFDDIK